MLEVLPIVELTTLSLSPSSTWKTLCMAWSSKVAKRIDPGMRTATGQHYQQSLDHSKAMQLFQYEQQAL